MRSAHARHDASRAAAAVFSILLALALPVAAEIPGESVAPEQLQRDTTTLLLELDAAAAPGCGSRTLVKAELIRPPAAASPSREAGAAGPWQERWHLDRCGDAVAWDVWYTPAPRGGVVIGVGLAAPGESAPVDPARTGERRGRQADPPVGRTFLVTNTNDSGPGSLTQAILDANAAGNQDGIDVIRFEIPGPGPHSISPLAAFPAITDPVVIAGDSRLETVTGALPDGGDPTSMVVLDGSQLSQPAHGLLLRTGSSTIRGLRVHGFKGDGIRIEGGGSNVIERNVLGGAGDGASGGSNAGSGVAIVDSPDNAIGGSAPFAGNTIAGNDGRGVRISGAGSTGNTILGNRIVRNGSGGIELEADALDSPREPGTGPNRFQRPPTLTSVAFPPARAGQTAEATVEGVFEGDPSATYRIELFATNAQLLVPRIGSSEQPRERLPGSEGERLLASAEVTTGADGRAGFLLRLSDGIHSRDSVTATATDRNGNTSEFSEPLLAPAMTISWNAGTGNWGTAANWSPAQLPAAGDDVVIGANGANTTFTVTLDVAATVNSLNLGGGSGTQTLSIASPTLTLNGPSTVNANGVLSLSGGTVAGAGSLSVNGTLNWSGGLMTGTGVTTVNGPFNLSGLVAINANRTLNNASTANWTSASGLGIRTGSGSVINNTGTWDAKTDGAAILNYYGGATNFNNSGIFRKSAGTGTTSVNIAFSNTGTVDVQSGTLSLGANGSSTAALTVSGASATLLFAAGVFDLNAGTTVGGPGTVLLNSSGTLNANSAVTVPAATTFTFLAGTLGGTGALTMNGTFNWSGGVMTGAGVTTVNGPFNLSGLTAINANRTLNNATTANWTSASGLGIRTGSGSVINNTGTWNAQTDGAEIVNYYGGATSFNNSGTFKKSAGTGTSSVNIALTNTGTVDVQSGTLSLGAGGSSAAALTVSGASATLLFAAGVFDLNAGTTVGGPGTVLLNSSGTLNVNSSLTIPAATTFTFLAGTLGGTGTLISNGTFNWSGGLMTGAGVTTVNGPFNLSGLVAINANRTLNNASTANWTSASGLGIRTGSGSVINNTGTWDAKTDGAVIINYYGGATTFNNSGTFKKSAGTGTSSVNIALTNTGTIDVQSGTLSLGATGSSSAALTVSGASATLLFAAGVFDLNTGTTVSGPGTVLLNSSGTLNFNTAVSIPAATTFTFLAGTLGGTGALTMNGTFNWSGGVMTGAGVTTVNGPFNLSGLVGINGSRTLNNASTANWTSANGLGVRTGGGSVINNTGTWDAQTDGAAIISYYAGATNFNNSGTFRKSAGAGTTSISVTFSNTGTVDVQSGTLSLGANGSNAAALAVSGASATLLFAAGVFDLNTGTTVSGPGTVLLNSSGTLNANSAVTFPAATTFTFLAGTLGGTGALTMNGTFNWSGGVMTGAGVTTVNGPFNLSGLVGINGGRTLNNASTANWSSANGLGVRTGGGSVINNTGIWDAQTDGAAIVSYYGGATNFNNSGTFRKSAGSGTTSITVTFTNTGNVDIQSGTLSLGATGSSSAALNVSGASATLLFAAGVFDLNAGTTVAGPGTVLLNSSGTLNVNSAVAFPVATTFTFLAGTLAGTGALTTNGTFNWSGGLMTGAGVTTLNGPLNLSGLVAINGSRILNNAATATWTSANGLGMRTGSGSVINNTGTWDARTDGAAIINYYSGTSTFNNSGTFRKSAGTGTSSISVTLTNTGTVDVQSGTLNVSGSSYKQTAGITRLTGGALSSTSSIAIQGGPLAGSGTITGPVIVSGTGVLSPGLSTGTLSLVGNYTQQGPAGAFNVEIGGTTPGSQFDTVNVSGAGSVATLAGVLNVSLVNSFVPAAGDSFTIMTYPSHTGTYTLNLPTIPCLGWKATYGATALVLTAFPLPTEVTGLAFPVTKVDMAWESGVSGPTRTWDVLKGDLRQLPVGTGPNESCLAQAVPGTTASDPATPAPNRGFWYVVRERVAGCGIGTYGSASSGTERTSTACP